MKSLSKAVKRNLNWFRFSILTYFLISLFPYSLFSQEFPEKPNQPRLVNDFAKIYSSEEAGLLEQQLRAYNDSTSTQIAIVTVTSLDGYPVDDYTIKLGNKWGIGQKGKNNGILILIAKEDRKAYIATGYGMEGALNDGKLGTILRREMIPYFKTGDYYGGTKAGIDAMIAAAAGEYASDDSDEKQKRGFPWQLILFGGLFFVIIIISKARKASSYARLNNVPFWVAWSIINAALNRGNRGGGGFFGGGGSSFGGGGGGGFGGFGGGSFGGGGAGGSW
ncbi:MAG: TPM domain-containing protein [Bacteroidia bacterium]